MEIILKEDIKGLGYKDDLVEVKDGYGRNFLIPQGMAIMASEANRKTLEENMRQAAHKAEKALQDAKDWAAKIGELTVEVKAKAGEKGRIFGAVTPIQVADALAAKGHKLDRKKITLLGDVKQLGSYQAELDLHKEVKHNIEVLVVEEA